VTIGAPELVKAAVNGVLGLAGLRLARDHRSRLSPLDMALHQILAQLDISVVFDVGAHAGEYAARLRKLGYRRRIVSFEPQAAAFATLAKQAMLDSKWDALPVALGDCDGEAVLNVSANSMSSSFLTVLPNILQVEAGIAQVATERVQLSRLDRIYRQFSSTSDAALLKIDAQGYEPKVLAGARELLATCDAVQMEMALFPSYRGQKLLPEMIISMSHRGFALVHLERGFWDRSSGYLIEADGIFVRMDRLAAGFADRPDTRLAAGSESVAQLQTVLPS
jgi:FkbM family methyltransferase